jgi:hypothetical protein
VHHNSSLNVKKMPVDGLHGEIKELFHPFSYVDDPYPMVYVTFETFLSIKSQLSAKTHQNGDSTIEGKNKLK